MKVCVFGAGAIGGYLGARLALAGQDVTLVGRGPHLRAMQARGIRLLIDGGERVAHPDCVEDPTSLGAQDTVFVTLKAHSVLPSLEGLRALLGPETRVVWGVNGVPWWYFFGQPGPWEGRRLQTVDPGGATWDSVDPERVIGCVVYPAVEVMEPGLIKHVHGDRFTLGEPNGERTARVRTLARLLIDAGLRAPVRRIREEIWGKLVGNLPFNSISALTRATLDRIATDPGTSDLARTMMREARGVAEALGIGFSTTIEQRLKGAAGVGPHRTSMLQDLEAGRPMEIDALGSAVVEMADLVGVEVPMIRAVLALLSQRAEFGNG